jgi:hypothetical protein
MSATTAVALPTRREHLHCARELRLWMPQRSVAVSSQVQTAMQFTSLAVSLLHPAAAACAGCVSFDDLLLHVQVLQSAKGDERVKGLLTVLGDRANFGGMAQLQELRNALLDFRVSRLLSSVNLHTLQQQ